MTDTTPPVSVLDQIRAVHRQAEARRRLIDIPVWWSNELPAGHEIVIRCKPVSAERVMELTGAVAADVSKLTVEIVANVLAEATIDIRLVGPKGDASLDPDGGPVKFEPRLAEIMEWDDPPLTAAAMVARFLRSDEAPLAVAAASGALQAQLAGGAEVVARETLGESTAAG